MIVANGKQYICSSNPSPLIEHGDNHESNLWSHSTTARKFKLENYVGQCLVTGGRRPDNRKCITLFWECSLAWCHNSHFIIIYDTKFKADARSGKRSPESTEWRRAESMVPFLLPHSSLVRMKMAGSDHRRLEGHPRRSQSAMGFNLCVFKMWPASRW